MSYNELRKGRFSELSREYFVTAVINDRKPIFNDFYDARLLVQVLRASEAEYGNVLAWVIMPDHVHVLLQLQMGDLSMWLKHIKGSFTRRYNQKHSATGSVWQAGFYDRALREEDDRQAVARYLVANPLRAGLVKSISDYPHWDSVWL